MNALLGRSAIALFVLGTPSTALMTFFTGRSQAQQPQVAACTGPAAAGTPLKVFGPACNQLFCRINPPLKLAVTKPRLSKFEEVMGDIDKESENYRGKILDLKKICGDYYSKGAAATEADRRAVDDQADVVERSLQVVLNLIQMASNWGAQTMATEEDPDCGKEIFDLVTKRRQILSKLSSDELGRFECPFEDLHRPSQR